MPQYQYSCSVDGGFEQKEPMMQDHFASCPVCAGPATRVYSLQGWIYDHPKPLFYKDGSYEEK
jgi:putative FmdB family regulatory protein